MRAVTFALALALTFVAAHKHNASAVTLEFEEASQCNQSNHYGPTPYNVAGFSFLATTTQFSIHGRCIGIGISNGTDFGYWGDTITNPPIQPPETIHYDLVVSSAVPFSIQQVDLGQAGEDAGGGTIRVSGLYSGGGAPSSIEFDTLRGSFTTFLFPNEWTNLTQVEFRQLDGLVVRNVMDNVVVNENFPIPEPSTVTLAVVALLTCCGRRKQR